MKRRDLTWRLLASALNVTLSVVFWLLDSPFVPFTMFLASVSLSLLMLVPPFARGTSEIVLLLASYWTIEDNRARAVTIPLYVLLVTCLMLYTWFEVPKRSTNGALMLVLFTVAYSVFVSCPYYSTITASTNPWFLALDIIAAGLAVWRLVITCVRLKKPDETSNSPIGPLWVHKLAFITCFILIYPVLKFVWMTGWASGFFVAFNQRTHEMATLVTLICASALAHLPRFRCQPQLRIPGLDDANDIADERTPLTSTPPIEDV